MIEAPVGWRQDYGAHILTLHPPSGGGRIRYYERLPVRGLDATVRDLLGRDPTYRHGSVLQTLRIVTEEGEHGVLVPAQGTRAGAPALRYLGIVITDEFMAALDTLVLLRTQLAFLEKTSRELLLSISLGLGTRRRRFFYSPPPGWQALPNGLAATWYAPDFPHDATNLAVMPANPRTETPRALFQQYLLREQERGFVLGPAVEESAAVSDHGLTGLRFQLEGATPHHLCVMRDVVIFAAHAYRYVLRLETTNAERLEAHRELFWDVARSAQPVPLPARRIGDFADDRAVARLTTIWAE